MKTLFTQNDECDDKIKRGGGGLPVEKVEPFSVSEARGLERSEKCLV